MSSLVDKVIQVEAFYTALDKDLAAFQTKAKYSCISGCSKCCQSPTVEATILEMLPLAFHLYKENKAELSYDNLLDNTSSLCALYMPLKTVIQKGGCSEYPYRALICRLFGNSFTRDKIGEPSLLTCKDLKAEYPKEMDAIRLEAKEGMQVPLATNYFQKLTEIDYQLTLKQYPINEAMKLAIEMVLNHFHYSEPMDENHRNAS
ncbi:MAG: YkgJ family cysteine cluster protein [Cytophagales bacterium]|nr:YkgJ family cysteine cluster protein [Cytophaga sp.]